MKSRISNRESDPGAWYVVYSLVPSTLLPLPVNPTLTSLCYSNSLPQKQWVNLIL